MKTLIMIATVLSISIVAFSNQQSKKVALVKMKRGQAVYTTPTGKKVEIKKGLWLSEGAIIETSDKSFVRVSFIDKSSMNIGPKSKLKIEKFSKKEAGVINVLSGKIRSEVTKNYLNMKKGKSKLFVKSKNAVMGIRGTDFLFSTNPKTNTSTAVLFEGSVVFNKLNKKNAGKDLESIVNEGRKIKPGQFSVADRKNKATVPAKLSSKQFSKLMSNKEFAGLSKDQKKKLKSLVPPGLTGGQVKADNAVIADKLKAFAPEMMNKEFTKETFEDSKGWVKGQDIRPADGSVVHVDTGVIIPLGSDSVFDKGKAEWVSSSVGTIAQTGDYLPPQGFEMTDDGKLLKNSEDGIIREVVLEIKPVDQMKPLFEQVTIEYNDGKHDGPRPAGMQEGEEFYKDEEQLERPPAPEGDGYQPPSEHTYGAEQRQHIRNEGKTRVKLKID